MAQSNCDRGGRMAPPESSQKNGRESRFPAEICHHDTRGSPSISLVRTGAIADFPIRHRDGAYGRSGVSGRKRGMFASRTPWQPVKQLSPPLRANMYRGPCGSRANATIRLIKKLLNHPTYIFKLCACCRVAAASRITNAADSNLINGAGKGDGS